MREIKFRAWHKKKGLLFKIKNLLSFGADNEIWINENKQQPTNTLHGWAGRDIVLMQYTGLKDKCGQEIYEGDALGLWGDGEYMLLGFVGYGSQENIFAGMFALFDKDDHMNDFTLEDYAKPENWGHLEVIGNRYENPELLKAENEI